MLLHPIFRTRPSRLRHDPFREFDAIRRQMDAFFDAPLSETNRTGWPTANLHRLEDQILLTLAAPGLQSENLEIKAENHELLIRGERPATTPEGFNVVRRERRPVKFMRRFRLPRNVDQGAIEAKLNDGILTLTLPLLADSSPRVIPVGA